MSEEKAHLSVRIPKSLMKELKHLAVEKEVTVTELVLPLLEEYLEQYRK
jgi:hypothetical protein